MSADGTMQAVCGGAAPAGLVSISTSPTQTDKCLNLATLQLRVTRLRRAIKYSAELASEIQGLKAIMVTLTYAKVNTQEPRHISDFLESAGVYLRRRGHQFRYCWVGELQGRGALHYHVIVWLPRGVTLPKPDKRGWWPHGTTKIEWARSGIGYLVKYASKLRSKIADDDTATFPKGYRMHGAGGLDRERRERRSFHMLPAWIRNVSTLADKVRRSVGGGFTHKTTGEHFASPYKLACFRIVPGIGPVLTVRHTGATT